LQIHKIQFLLANTSKLHSNAKTSKDAVQKMQQAVSTGVGTPTELKELRRISSMTKSELLGKRWQSKTSHAAW